MNRREIKVNERVYEGLMRSDGATNPAKERQWFGVYPNRYKIMEGGEIQWETTIHTPPEV